MSSRPTVLVLTESRRGVRCGRGRRVLGIVAFSLVAVSGCRFGDGLSRAADPVEIIEGQDSAGATIELETRGDDLTRARVIDVILGTGESEITSDEDGYIAFTIDFPAGATIAYVGTIHDPGASTVQAIAGTWTQHSAGIFGEDTGTWHVSQEVPGT